MTVGSSSDDRQGFRQYMVHEASVKQYVLLVAHQGLEGNREALPRLAGLAPAGDGCRSSQILEFRVGWRVSSSCLLAAQVGFRASHNKMCVSAPGLLITPAPFAISLADASCIQGQKEELL